jgi:signal transduction histidine kinase
MRTTPGEIYIDKKGRRYRRMSFEQRAQIRKRYIANVPKWRHPSVGYFSTLPLVGVIILCSVYLAQFMGHLLFSSSLYILVVCVALLWGVGPALFAILLSSIALYNFSVKPLMHNVWSDWQTVLQLLPFVISGLIIALITSQRERARLLALETEQELQTYAEELEAANQRLEDANQMKDRFLSIASHELKTPITTIRGQAQLMLRRISKKSPTDLNGITATLERINEQTTRLTMLIDELLDVSSMRAGKAQLNRRTCDIRDLCRQVVEDQRLLTGRPIGLTMPDTPQSMHVDVDRLSQVLTNLISNAVKYSPDNSPVAVVLDNQPECVTIRVQDQGRGIPKDQQEHIFETFYRTPDAQSSAKRGLGLGLAITRDIVERHGGKIRVESEENRGSTFIVELPLAVSESSVPAS